jgi:hypothetical protein
MFFTNSSLFILVPNLVLNHKPTEGKQSAENKTRSAIKKDSIGLKKKVEKKDTSTQKHTNTEKKVELSRSTAKAVKETTTVALPKQHPRTDTAVLTPIIRPDSLLADTLRANDTIKKYYHATDTTKGKLNTIVEAKPKDTIQYIPFYSHHALLPTHKDPVLFNKYTQDWISAVLILLIMGLTFVKVMHHKSLKQLKEALFSITISNQVVRDDNVLLQRATSLLTIIFYVIAALFITQVTEHYHMSMGFIPHGFLRFFVFLLLIALIYTLKLFCLRLLGFVFLVEKPTTAYSFNVFLINNALGVMLLPILIGIYYMPSGYYLFFNIVALTLVVIAFIYRVFRGIMIGVSHPHFSLYYLFLYLCALELAPLVFLAKLIV